MATVITTDTTSTEVISAEKPTPMMAQFLAVKSSYPNALLFYRMGDFYELFFDDAIKAAETLDIALTKRGKYQGEDIPMCGVPHHSYEPYLQKLIKAGFNVAICEQMETPEEAKKRGYKAVVKREVVRIVTPGTLMEEGLLEATKPNFLASLAQAKGQYALAWVDISVGTLQVQELSEIALSQELTRLNIKELILAEKTTREPIIQSLWREHAKVVHTQADIFFDSFKAESRLLAHYGINKVSNLGALTRAEISACGALIEYLDLTQKGVMPRLSSPKKYKNAHFMQIDAATRRNLELVETTDGQRQGSLLHTIDYTKSAAGARMLSSYMASPLSDADAINRRLDMVEWCKNHSDIREELADVFSHMPDIERALSRLYIGKGGPRDLAVIRDGLKIVQHIASIIEFSPTILPEGIKQQFVAMGSHDELLTVLTHALMPEVPILARDGGFITKGFDPQLDHLRDIKQHTTTELQQLQQQYRQLTKINSLKISKNNVLGYFVDVTPTQVDKIKDEIFIHRQTLANSVRYTTEELRKLEQDLLSASDKAKYLEHTIFEDLRLRVIQQIETISLAANASAVIDAVNGLAIAADKMKYCRPIVDHTISFNIQAGRHPVVESMMSSMTKQEAFVSNDCQLTDKRVCLLTGPNMAGKSTYLRQNALIALMAQMGSFVSADAAHVGIVDRLFSRVGASDNIAKGQSTFMVEMVETATILNQATAHSLVILDELGRGTSTYDGLSIAWASLEYLHEKCQSRTMFATHYHELTELINQLKYLDCFTMQVREWNDDIVFMHKVIHGAAERSYGLHVAKLAGVPRHVITRAEHVLSLLQETALNEASDLPLFSRQAEIPSCQESVTEYGASPVEEELQQLDVDQLTPKQALEFLYDLKEKLV